ncbi:MAG: hypothetical protein GC168_00055 [Candidatus Hydrogenedens sp.]|nr:hypothetical protein [Candidatus Hydrogenedens sp.]
MAQVGGNGDIKTVAYSPDGTQLAVGTSNNVLYVMDVATKRMTKVLALDLYQGEGIAWSVDGTKVYYCGFTELVSVNAATGAELWRTPDSGGSFIKVSDDGTRILCGKHLHRSSDGALLFTHSYNDIDSLGLSRDGTKVLVGATSNLIQVRDALTGVNIGVLSGATRQLYGIWQIQTLSATGGPVLRFRS